MRRSRARGVRRALLLLSLAAATACATTGSGVAGAPSDFGARGDRRLIGSFAQVFAVGASRRLVFAATPAGIAIHDRFLGTWLPPLTRENGFTDPQITVVAADPVEEALWYGVPGAVVSYRPTTDQLQRTPVTGIPDLIAFNRTNIGDVYVRAGGAWTHVSRVGISTPIAAPPAASALVVPGDLDDVHRLFPALRTAAGLLLRDTRAERPLRSYNVVSGAISPDRSNEVWLGTDGDGLYRVDPAFQQATPLRFGLIETGVGAVAVGADGVWSAGLGLSPQRGGLTFATPDLQRWRWIDGTITVPLIGVRATAISLFADRAWIATDRGVVRARLDASESLRRWTTLDGLPDDRVLAIAARRDPVRGDGAWVGTARGLSWVSDSAGSRAGEVNERVIAGASIDALLPIGDTLWIGSSAGLLAFPTRGGALSRVVSPDPLLRTPVRALAWSDTMLLAATDDAVFRLAPRATVAPTRVLALDPRQTGGVMRLAMDDRTIVMAGPDGVLLLSRLSGATRVLRVGSDLLAPALDIALARDWIWLATPAGLLRLRRAGDGGIP